MKILIVDNGIEFDLETPYNKCLGGSETTALLLGKGLSLLGHQVVIVNNIQEMCHDKNIFIDNINNFYPYAKQSDIIILNRFIPQTIMDFVKEKKVFLISHDAYDQPNVRWMMNANAEQYLDKIICVSEWQKETFIKYLRVDPKKLTVLGNPIDYSLYCGYTERDPNKLVFTSIPYKGLEILPDLFDEIKLRSKNDKLHLDVYSSFDLYGREEENEQFKSIYQRLNNTNNVNIFKPVSMKQLAYVFKTASLNLAPSTYHETFGRVFVEAAAGGCITVCMNNGANKEMIGNSGYVLDYSTIYNKEAFDKFVNEVCYLLTADLYNMRMQIEREMKKWDYIKMCKKLENIIT